MTNTHHINCAWQLDQYDFECDCGATRPKTTAFVQGCIATISSRKEGLEEELLSLTAELREMMENGR
jgi:hypothetical protein